jgi:pilus assembly protein Flp/PilA
MEIRNGERGATAVEYGIMVALIAVVIIGAVYLIGTALDTDFDRVGTCVGTPTAAGCP